MMWWYPGPFGWGMMLLGALATLVVWVGLVVAVIWAIRSLMGGRAGERPGAEQPLEILRRRFAAGEITQEEYERARRALGQGT